MIVTNFKLSKHIKEIRNHPAYQNVSFTARNIFSHHVCMSAQPTEQPWIPTSYFGKSFLSSLQIVGAYLKIRSSFPISNFSQESSVRFTNLPEISRTGEVAALTYIPISYVEIRDDFIIFTTIKFTTGKWQISCTDANIYQDIIRHSFNTEKA